jgi:hypothetical protein
MSNFVTEVNWKKYFALDDYFWQHQYWYIKFEDGDTWLSLDQTKREVLRSLPKSLPKLEVEGIIETAQIKDKIVEQVINKFNSRSEVGIKKYWTTLEDNNTDDFLKHLQEELFDAILYIQKLMSQKKD